MLGRKKICFHFIPAPLLYIPTFSTSELLTPLCAPISEVMRVVISEGGVKLIVSLLDSAHLSLRNEALLALNLLAVVKEDGEFRTALTDEVVVGGVWGVVSAGDSSPELVSNALTFLVLLAEKQWTGIIPLLQSRNCKHVICVMHS